MREDLIERLRERAEFEDKRVLDEAKALGFVPEVYSGSQTGALLREAADALEAAREDGWRPIETAPKDGTRVMLGNEHGAWVADWRPVYQSGYRPDTPWHSAMLNCDHITREHRYKPATHWRPLPAPPAIDQARGKGVA